MRTRNPIWNFIPNRTILVLATLGPLGQLKAPGTWGSLAGILLYTVLFPYLAPLPYFILCLVLVLVAVPLCEEAEIRLGKRDPGCVILDEFVAIPICFFALATIPGPHTWAWILGGFLLFRFFDIVKPSIIGRLQSLRGGWGVVMDDVAAAIATNIILQILVLILYHQA